MRAVLVDAEIVDRRLREIGRRLGALREVRAHGEETFIADLVLQAQAEQHLQLALQRAIDIALHILAEDTDRTPEDYYGSAFRELATAGVLKRDLANRLRLAAGLRNVLVHAYLDVDPARIWTHLHRLGDLEDFAHAVDAYMRRLHSCRGWIGKPRRSGRPGAGCRRNVLVKATCCPGRSAR